MTLKQLALKAGCTDAYLSQLERGRANPSISPIGEECGIVLQGKLEIDLNGKTYSVGKNESFYFSSQEPHSWTNPGKRRTVVIWVVSPLTF